VGQSLNPELKQTFILNFADWHNYGI
jgi:hypothetical protein